jgi:hypothetical protein
VPETGGAAVEAGGALRLAAATAAAMAVLAARLIVDIGGSRQ